MKDPEMKIYMNKITKLLEKNNKEMLKILNQKTDEIINILKLVLTTNLNPGNVAEDVAKEVKKEIKNDQAKLLDKVSNVDKQLKKVVEDKSEAEQMLLIDELTGIRNRLGFNKKFKEELFLSKRYQHPLSIVMIDLDDFKSINDNYGHPAGDFVLVEMTKLIKSQIRSIDFIARWGGEEFILVLPETPINAGFNLSDRIRAIIAEHKFKFKKKVMKTTISGGIASYPEDGSNEDILIKKADEKLLQSKRNGKNKITV